ncbi:GHMP family kinase ATP-binding protein [Paenibacillus sp. OSY-SE]|uniref:GHMP family kinase ATP-binding protein n=1 Tax=Paenibacillus sp. OSY-SE TaxID=1196323 RepID=UPI0002D40830|nr:hypothetical protein [Paenibacillus sp. OSY-SE]
MSNRINCFETNRSGTGLGYAFGTFGELLQGALDEKDSEFLVTFPIQTYSRASFNINPDCNQLTVKPQNKSKSYQLACMILKQFHLPLNGVLEIDSEIPVGKGMASSSADLVSTARAIASYYSLRISNELLNSFLQQIEPTDGVMYHEVVVFYHRQVKLGYSLGHLPPLTVVSIDEGGEVDTVLFNKTRKMHTISERREYAMLLDKMINAMEQRDIKTVGQIATQSAVLNQSFMYKNRLDDLIDICSLVNGLGVIVAHSGTCLGIMLEQSDQHYTDKLKEVSERLLELDHKVDIYYSWENDVELRLSRGEKIGNP